MLIYLRVIYSKNKSIDCILAKEINFDKTQNLHSYLYKVKNYKELQNDKEFIKKLNEWINEYEEQKFKIEELQSTNNTNVMYGINEIEYL